MASYQFIIEFIPKAWVENKKNNIALLFDNGFYDLSVTWKEYQSDPDLKNSLSKILPESRSWNMNLMVWGDQEKSDIQVRISHSCIEYIRFRVDLRKNIDSLLLSIINLAIKLKCNLFLPSTKQIIDPKFDLLKKIIARSDSAKFVNDPNSYIREIKKS